MLRHQDHPETIAPRAAVPAAEERVTAEELAGALTAIEARRAERTRQREGTIPIGEALRQLGLEAAPDEILEEVRAQRARQAQIARTVASKPRPRHWIWIVLTAPAFLLLGLLGLRTGVSPPMVASPQVVAIAPIGGGQSAIRVIDESGERQVLRTLAEVGDNRPLRCGWADAVSLLSGGEAGTAAVQEMPQEQHESRRWRLIKLGGKIYLRGWLALPMSEAALQTGAVTLYSARPSSEGATQITLPVGTCRYQGGSVGSEPEQILLAVSSLDERAWQKW